MDYARRRRPLPHRDAERPGALRGDRGLRPDRGDRRRPDPRELAPADPAADRPRRRGRASRSGARGAPSERGGTVTVHVPEFPAVHRELTERADPLRLPPRCGHPARPALLHQRRRAPLHGSSRSARSSRRAPTSRTSVPSPATESPRPRDGVCPRRRSPASCSAARGCSRRCTRRRRSCPSSRATSTSARRGRASRSRSSSLAVAMGGFAWGPLSDRIGRPRAIRLASLAPRRRRRSASRSHPTFGVAPRLPRRCRGCACRACSTVGAPYVVETFVPRIGARAMGWYVVARSSPEGSSGGSGVALASAVVGWRVAIGALAVFPLAAAIADAQRPAGAGDAAGAAAASRHHLRTSA